MLEFYGYVDSSKVKSVYGKKLLGPLCFKYWTARDLVFKIAFLSLPPQSAFNGYVS